MLHYWNLKNMLKCCNRKCYKQTCLAFHECITVQRDLVSATTSSWWGKQQRTHTDRWPPINNVSLVTYSKSSADVCITKHLHLYHQYFHLWHFLTESHNQVNYLWLNKESDSFQIKSSLNKVYKEFYDLSLCSVIVQPFHCFISANTFTSW